MGWMAQSTTLSNSSLTAWAGGCLLGCQDVNWKAVMRYLGSREMYEDLPATRRAGEVDVVYYDGGKVEVEKEPLLLAEDRGIMKPT